MVVQPRIQPAVEAARQFDGDEHAERVGQPWSRQRRPQRDQREDDHDDTREQTALDGAEPLGASAVQAVPRHGRQVVGEFRAHAGRFVAAAFAHHRAGLQVRDRHRRREHRGHHHRHTDRAEPRHRQAPPRDQHRPDHRQQRRQEDGVVDRRHHLQAHHHAEADAVAHAAAIDETVQEPQRQRHPLGLQELEVGVVIEAEGQECEDGAGHQRRAAAAREVVDERRHPDARSHDAEHEQQVVDPHRSGAEPEERRAEQRRREQRLRVGERAPFGMEDVGVEEPGGR